MLKPKKNHSAIAAHKKLDAVGGADSKLITEQELARLLGLSVKQAVRKALELRFSRIPVNRTHYYSKRQVYAYLIGNCIIK